MPRATSDITIWDETSDNAASVDASGDLQTKNNNGSGASAVNIQDGGNSITVDGTVDTELPTAAALADGAANPTTPMVGADLQFFNGTTWDRARGDITNGLDVDVTRITPGTGATNLGKAEDTAHATGDVGIQVLAVRNDAGVSFVGADGDYIPLSTDPDGNLRVNITAVGNSGSPANETVWQTAVRLGYGFWITTNFLSISGTAETPFMLIRNAGGSGKILRIKRMEIAVVATVTGDNARVKIYRDPTITTNGTALTANKVRKSQSATPVVSYYRNPTISASGTLLWASAMTQAYMQSVDYDLTMYCEEGEDLYITIQPANTNKNHVVSLWVEEEDP